MKFILTITENASYFLNAYFIFVIMFFVKVTCNENQTFTSSLNNLHSYLNLLNFRIFLSI